jgi:hypothetical protein
VNVGFREIDGLGPTRFRHGKTQGHFVNRDDAPGSRQERVPDRGLPDWTAAPDRNSVPGSICALTAAISAFGLVRSQYEKSPFLQNPGGVGLNPGEGRTRTPEPLMFAAVHVGQSLTDQEIR